jgi:hypothetical protein
MLPHQQTLSQTHPRPSALRRAGPTTEPPTFHDSIALMTIANEILLNGETLRFEHGGNVVAYPLEALSLINRLGVQVPLCIAWLRHGYHTYGFLFAFLDDETCILEFLVWLLLRLERGTEQGLNAQHRSHWLSLAFKG